jgi:hypothetical protein
MVKDNQKKYLDKVVDLIVSDTIIDYEREVIQPPFLSSHPIIPIRPSNLFHFPASYFVSRPFFLFFSRYCENTYGLGEDEIKYTWEKYTNKLIK